MIRLNLSNAPRWVDVPGGARLCVRPITTDILQEVHDEMRAAAEAGDAVLPRSAFGRAVARRAIVDWQGVAGEDGGAAPVTPEHIDALMDIAPVFSRFHADCVAPAMLLVAEGNVSPASPSGTSAAAEGIAPRAPGSAPSVPPGPIPA